jgi:WD40 repeat protein
MGCNKKTHQIDKCAKRPIAIAGTIGIVVWLFFCGVACATVSEGVPQPILADPDLYTQKFSSINNENIGRLKQVNAFHMDYRGSTEIIFKYILGSNKLVACCDTSNSLLVWDVLSETLLSRRAISSTNITPYEFTLIGDLLLGKIDAVGNSLEQDNFGVFIWNTNTAEVSSCLWANCDQIPILDYETSDAVIHPNGKLVIETGDYNVFLYDVERDEFLTNPEINCPDCAYWWQIGDVAYDAMNDRYAIIFQEGRIEMYYLDWATSPNPSVSRRIVINSGIQNDLQPVHEAEFDNSGRRLAYARGNKLKVLEIKQRSARKAFEIEIDNITDLMFDQTGEFLFVSSDNFLYIYDARTGELVSTYDTPGITTIDISLDNRLILYGEAGQVHILGDLKP